MIIKSFETSKINLEQNKLILLYGKNEGYKSECIDHLIKGKNKEIIFFYYEKEILDNTNTFLEEISSKSLFEDEKIIILKRASDKILNVIEKIKEKEIQDLIVILNAENLEKKSKLRTFFEKSKNSVCVPFYPDNEQTLNKLALNFLKTEKIFISQENINLLINKTNGDRENLKNELEKIKYYSINGKKITSEEIMKLTNLTENHSIMDLINSCLAKNKKKTISILNDNYFSNEDCIQISRALLNKSKKLLTLLNVYENNRNLELTITTAKPPIFWKDKEITKEQIFKWPSKNMEKLIYEINDLELAMKKNINNSMNLITNFILEKSSL